MHCAHFVIQDLEKEGRDDLPDSCEIGVGRLSSDRLELIEGMRKFHYDLFGRHFRAKMACPSSSGYGAAIFGVLLKHRVITTYIEEHHRCFGLGGYFMAAVLAAASYSRIGFSTCLAVHVRRVRVPGGSVLHLEPVTIHPCWNLTGT